MIKSQTDTTEISCKLWKDENHFLAFASCHHRPQVTGYMANRYPQGYLDFHFKSFFTIISMNTLTPKNIQDEAGVIAAPPQQIMTTYKEKVLPQGTKATS